MKIDEIIIATGNKGKVSEFKKMLGELNILVRPLIDLGDFTEFEENGITFQENARGKAEYYSRLSDKIVVADDSGLEVDALAGAPGVRSARFAGVDGPDKDNANNQKLLSDLSGIAQKDRSARFRCCLCLASPEGVIFEASGTFEGEIGFEPRGQNGFGYDPLFFVPELGKTAAELEYSEKNNISHRGMAMKTLMVHLKGMIES